MSHLLPGAGELCPGVAGQHGDDDHLAPLLHVHQQVAQLSVVLMDQVYTIWTHFLKGHHHAASHQLQESTKKYRCKKEECIMQSPSLWFLLSVYVCVNQCLIARLTDGDKINQHCIFYTLHLSRATEHTLKDTTLVWKRRHCNCPWWSKSRQ